MLDVLYPPSPACLWCGLSGEPAPCRLCGRSLALPPAPRCTRCRRVLDGPAPAAAPPRRCPACRVRAPAYAGVTAVAPYAGLGRWTVGAVKSGGETVLLAPLARLLAARLAGDAVCFQALVPLPADRRRLRERGFDPARLLSARVAALSRRPLLDALERSRPTAAQSSLRGSARRRNLRGVLRASPQGVRRVRGLSLLLVDDVITTGSTLDAGARALLEAGACSVWAAVLADNMPRGRG